MHSLGNTSLLLESVDQTTGGSIVLVAWLWRVELGLDLLGEALSELNTPLVEGVDVPDGALSEGDVLVVGDQSSESGWSDLLGEDRGGWAVAQEGLVRDKLVWGTLGLDLVW